MQFDAVLMMQQTELLQMVGNGCEIDARIEHQSADFQTVRRPRKHKKSGSNPHG